MKQHSTKGPERSAICLAGLAVAIAGGCYLSHGPAVEDRDADAAAPWCSASPDLRCVRREAGPCSALVEIPAVCDPAEDAWRCPAGSRIYEAAAPTADCLPFQSADGPLESLGSGGITLETGDGRCLWILGDGVLADGSLVAHPAVAVPGDLPVGACPASGSFVGGSRPRSVIDPAELGVGSLVSPGDAVRYGDRSWLYCRHWTLDGSSPFGVRKLGTKLGWFDESAERVRFVDGYLWLADRDYGDSALLIDGVPYVYGCYGEPRDLGYDCRLARGDRGPIESVSSYRYYSATADWVPDEGGSAVVFLAGPHRSSVRYLAARGRYIHVSIEGFGDHIDYSLAERPEGPWSAPATLASCRLPSDDPDALCGYPMIHPELSDPFEPSEIVVSYDVTTLAPDAAERRRTNPAAYWPRLVRARVP